MLPTEQFSGDACPAVPWKPAVWSSGPQQLVADAQRDLWGNDSAIVNGTLGSPGDAMSGSTGAPENEAEQMINPGQPPEGQGRATQWKNSIKSLYETGPLVGTPSNANPDA